MKPLTRSTLPVFLTLAASPLVSAQSTWTGAVSESWTTPANWSPASLPDSADDVLIESGDALLMGTHTTIRTLTMGSAVTTPSLRIFGLTGLTTQAGGAGALGIDIRSGSLTVEEGAEVNTQSVMIRGDGVTDLVHIRGGNWVSGSTTRWVNTGNLTIGQGGVFRVEDLANVDSRGHTLIDGGQAILIGDFRTRSNWNTGQLVINDNAANSDPDLEIRLGGRLVSESAVVRGVVELSSASHPFYHASVWSAGSMLVEGGTIEVNSSILRTGRLSIQGGLVEAYHSDLRTGDLKIGNGGRMVLDGSVLRFDKAGTVLSDIDPGELVIGDDGAIISAYLKDGPVVIDTSLEGTGEVWFSGSGIVLTHASTYQGGTFVDGALFVNNQEGSGTGSGDVVVDFYGTLGGDGFIAGNVLNRRGTVSPGNSAGTLHIGGNFQQDGDGKMLMEIDSPYSHDVLKVDGTVKLAGTLQVENGSGLAYGQQFDLIQAGGGITGSFDSIKLSNTDVRARFVTDGGTGLLAIAPLTYSRVATNRNERSVAAVLDPWIDDTRGDTRVVSENLDLLSAEQYRVAFSDLSPALHMAGVATAIEQSQGQMNALNQHVNSRRLRPTLANDAENLWEAWAISTGAYSPGSMSSLEGEDYSAGNFIAGIERQVAPGFTAGLFNSYGDSEGDFAGASKVEQERFTLGAHATAQYNGSYANTALGFGVLEMDVRRAIDFGNLSRRARSSTDGTEFFTMISGGHDFREGNWIFGPSASLQYSKVRYDDVKENGAGALDLAVANPEDDSLRSQLGGRVAYLYKANEKLTLIPEARVFWQHEFLRDNETLDAAMEQGLGLGFAHQVADSDGDSVFTGVGLGFQTDFGFYGNVSYDIEIGRESDVNQTLSVAADWKF